MIDRQNIFDQPVRNDVITYDSILKIAIGQGNNYMTGCLLNYNLFHNYYKKIEIDLTKQQELDADLKAIQQINFTGNLGQDLIANATMFFIIEEAKETVLYFWQGTVKVF